MSSTDKIAHKKLVYKGSVYVLAKTDEDMAIEHVGEIAAKIVAIAKEPNTDPTKAQASIIHKRDRIGNLLAEMTLHLKVLGLQSPLI